jgi:hypothetical protein
VIVPACRLSRRPPRAVTRCPRCSAPLAGLVVGGFTEVDGTRGQGVCCRRCRRVVALTPDPADSLRVVTVAEAVESARWTSELFEAIESTPVPVATGRGPPSRCSAAATPWRVRTGIELTTATRKGAPNMTPIREKAPKRFPVRDFLKIVCPIHKTLAASLMRIAPAGAVVRSAVVFTSCAAGPDSTGGRYVVLAD